MTDLKPGDPVKCTLGESVIAGTVWRIEDSAGANKRVHVQIDGTEHCNAIVCVADWLWSVEKIEPPDPTAATGLDLDAIRDNLPAHYFDCDRLIHDHGCDCLATTHFQWLVAEVERLRVELAERDRRLAAVAEIHSTARPMISSALFGSTSTHSPASLVYDCGVVQAERGKR